MSLKRIRLEFARDRGFPGGSPDRVPGQVPSAHFGAYPVRNGPHLAKFGFFLSH